MKKALLIIFAVAILGALGLYLKRNGSATTSLGTKAGTISSQSAGSAATTDISATNYADGTYQGNAAETQYGAVQISVVISGGKISDVEFLKMPGDEGRSIEITNQARPLLKQNALRAQGPKIDFVSGATSTSYGFEESLQAALNAASGA